MRRLFRHKKGVFTYWVIFAIFTGILLFLTAIFFPIESLMASEFYAAGGDIIRDANETISSIDNETIRLQITDALTEAQSAQQTNITVYSSMYRYAWIIILVIICLLLFIQTRKDVEGENYV
jgi:hypothetical protein